MAIWCACAGAVWVSKLRWDSCKSTPGGGHLPAKVLGGSNTSSQLCMRAVHVSKPRWDPCPGTPSGGHCSEGRTSVHAQVLCGYVNSGGTLARAPRWLSDGDLVCMRRCCVGV